MNVKVVIPARYDSSRLPGKMLMTIQGKPIIGYVIERVVGAGVNISDIYVATDSDEIVGLINSYDSDINTVLTCKSHQSGTDRINEVAKKMGWSPEQIVVNVQGDEPLISTTLIRKIIGFSKEDSLFDIKTATAKIKTYEELINPNVVKCVFNNYRNALYFSRSAIPNARDDKNNISRARKHIGIYSYTVRSLSQFCSYNESELESLEKLEQLRALDNGMSIGVFDFSGDVYPGIDTIEDFDFVKQVITGDS
ncbi:3-deoxy-manno-octulosonate cytidylyltransferase [Vibrio genomosp. F6]|uniref:3-deoxy-manno-octulosonate cytidylyltransferase n=1 Tax=Vibrio genomosp. F6 str. FF-238 TaxID=1191298 RepID=A0A1E5D3I5_9VIBR|nr:3-deoxy-manno-octulosonate cytidylyltransferase [Vibrio genomosp. F6]OEE77709.1 3-deoxy-manno-octulosonate cytidylyltransferase [Vibrio genomosp. F6 str. FF-238]